MTNKKLFGFTLAEVLITLAIIGVVAALTLPTLMSNYRKHVVETKLVKFYATVNQALDMAEADYGRREHWEMVRPGQGKVQNEDGKYIPGTQSAWAKKYLLPYIQGVLNFNDENGEVTVSLKDGSEFTISNYYIGYYPFGREYNNDGELKKGTLGYGFYYDPLNEGWAHKYTGHGIEPYKVQWDGNVEHLKRDFNSYTCYDHETGPGPYCTAVIQANGWKIPSDYPFHF